MASLTKKYKIGNYDFITNESSPYFITGAQSRQNSSRGNEKNNNKTPQTQDYRAPVSRNATSKAKSEMNYSRSGSSAYSASIKQRIEKACTTNSTNDLRKQNTLLTRQIEKLEKQLLKKDQQVIEMKTKVAPSKQVKSQTELFQLYRALSYFQGKTKEMERQIYKFRELILKSSDEGVTADSLSILFQQLRKDNQQLSAQIEQTQYMRASFQDKYNRLMTKYYETQRQLSEYKRREVSPLFQYYLNKVSGTDYKFNSVLHQLIHKGAPTNMELKQKQLVNKQLSLRLQQTQKQNELIREEMNKLSQELQKLKTEHLMLKHDIQGKDRQITQIFKDYMSTKKSLKKLEPQKNMSKASSQYIRTPSFKNDSQIGSFTNI